MRNKRAIFCLLMLTLASLLLFPDCATLTRRRAQKIPVTSSPMGATVIVDGVRQGLTPLEIKLARKEKDQVIRIECAGYNPLEIRVKRRTSAGPILSNVFLGTAFGIGVGCLVAVISGEGLFTQDPNPLSSTAAIVGIPAGIIGFSALDLGSGKSYSLEPRSLTVTLTKANERPRVDTIVIDSEDLRNIKWIRARRD